jgi:hypothetical protein
LLTMALLLLSSQAATVKFSPDQCRVLRQTGVDTTGLCPPPPKPKKQSKKQ